MKYFKFAVFLLFISSMYPWFLMNAPTVVITFIAVIFAIISRPKLHFEKSKSNTRFLIAMAFMLLWMAYKYNLFGIITTLASIYLLSMICRLDDSSKKEILSFITKGFAIIVGISIPFYILSSIGIPLPHGNVVFEDLGIRFENYYFFVKFPDSSRFQSVFLEPGHMTMGLAPILFLNRYDVKNKYVLLLIFAQLMSFSIAGIIVMGVGLIFTELLRPTVGQKIKGAVSVVLAFGVLIVLMYVFYGDDIIQTLVLDRLQINDGQLSGYNRTTLDVDELFDSVMASSNRWTGVDWDPTKYGTASGYRVFIITNGLIGAFFMVLSYLMPWITRKKTEMLFFSIILLLLLVQNGYPQWWCMMISLVLGPAYYNYQQVSLVNKKNIQR